MTPLMSLFLRCLLAIGLVVVMLSLSNFAIAATPVDTVHSTPGSLGPQSRHFVDQANLPACLHGGLRRFVIVSRSPVTLATRAAPGPLRSGG